MCKPDSELSAWFIVMCTTLSEVAFGACYLKAHAGQGVSLEVSHGSFHGSQHVALLLGGHSVLQVTVQGANTEGKRTKHCTWAFPASEGAQPSPGSQTCLRKLSAGVSQVVSPWGHTCRHLCHQ